MFRVLLVCGVAICALAADSYNVVFNNNVQGQCSTPRDDGHGHDNMACMPQYTDMPRSPMIVVLSVDVATTSFFVSSDGDPNYPVPDAEAAAFFQRQYGLDMNNPNGQFTVTRQYFPFYKVVGVADDQVSAFPANDLVFHDFFTAINLIGDTQVTIDGQTRTLRGGAQIAYGHYYLAPKDCPSTILKKMDYFDNVPPSGAGSPFVDAQQTDPTNLVQQHDVLSSEYGAGFIRGFLQISGDGLAPDGSLYLRLKLKSILEFNRVVPAPTESLLAAKMQKESMGKSGMNGGMSGGMNGAMNGGSMCQEIRATVAIPSLSSLQIKPEQ